ncbi:hypothetical protein I1A62_22645 [Rhodococcus sp. USK10]|uniref:DUF4286 family protein n=1 Tax=Rhodococcus wratislaviensis TaxID=44752 RepID=A0A402CEW1_RHOWR|nr:MULTISPECIES: DUF4286 family protein [Rhodococcus]QYB07077.1 hypothetical protein I1A62_22645 [Rhodococcus sp. USK10]GCE42166.1 hypothetical protein Rhow_006105 [Rhodococcus wratislaviensis]
MAKGLYLAFTHPHSPETETEMNEWYSTLHLPEVLALDGIESATRYRSIEHDSTYKYLAAYTLEGDLHAIVARLHAEGPNRTPTSSTRKDPGADFRLFEFVEQQRSR